MVVHDARREEFYLQTFAAEGEPLSAPELCAISHAADALLHRHWRGRGQWRGRDCAGSGTPGPRIAYAGFADLLPEAGDLAAIAVNKIPQHQSVAPLYLRAPDAKPQTDKSLARAG